RAGSQDTSEHRPQGRAAPDPGALADHAAGRGDRGRATAESARRGSQAPARRRSRKAGGGGASRRRGARRGAAGGGGHLDRTARPQGRRREQWQVIIETHQVGKRFGRFEAIDDLSLRVPEGSVFALIGANGAGKTTTIRMLMNILRPDRGDITVLDTPSRRIGPRDFQRIGYVSESQQLPGGLTLAQYFDYLGKLYSGWDRGLENTLCNLLELPPARRIRHLSHGMRMKALLV